MSENDIDPMFGRGDKNDAFAEYFVGQSYLNMLTTEGVVIANVTFEPGCRNNWHIHHASAGGGQILLATAGRGWYQAVSEDPVSLEPGVVVRVPAGKKHWQGAKVDSWLTHIAVEVPGEDTHNERLEPVTDEQYSKLNENRSNA
jgi:quercetin dioxygenase-like cupin family protein